MSINDQNWDPIKYQQNARFVSDLGAPVIQLLNPKSGEKILDLGCGDGALTIRLLDSGCNVVGVDSSSDMVNAARKLGLNVYKIDAHEIKFHEQFDAVFSNAALHWMASPERVIEGVWRALKPGGRFVGEFGGYGNVSMILKVLKSRMNLRGLEINNPWFFPTTDQYKKLLENQGFKISSIELIPRLTKLPGNIVDWLETFGKPLTASLSADLYDDFVTEVTEDLKSILCDADGAWHVDYIRLRFAAFR
ncbi:MAG: methyltransferase domain-containing protein [Pseudomonadota bacterium]|nr:methyltransferase domain-containing protein [Pseudomonadota bacterium]